MGNDDIMEIIYLANDELTGPYEANFDGNTEFNETTKRIISLDSLVDGIGIPIPYSNQHMIARLVKHNDTDCVSIEFEPNRYIGSSTDEYGESTFEITVSSKPEIIENRKHTVITTNNHDEYSIPEYANPVFGVSQYAIG